MFKAHKYLIRQYTAVLTVNLSSVCVGMGFGWPSPVLVKLMDPNERILSKTLSSDEASWIVSSAYLIVIFSSYPGGLAMDYFGRKFTIVICMFSKAVIELSLTFATEMWMLMVGRAFCSVIHCMLTCSTSAYSAEIASKEIRGSLLSILGICIAFGTLLMYCFGPYLSYLHLSTANTTIVVVCTIPILFIPESPYYLYSKGRREECEKVLIYFQESETKAKEEIEQYSNGIKETKMNSFKIFKNKSLYKSLIICIVFSILIQTAGQPILSNYMQMILEVTGTSIKSGTISVITGITQFLSGLFAALVIDKVGRKPMAIVSLLGAATGLSGMGAFFNLKENEYAIEGWINYIPLVSVGIVMLCYSIGSSSILVIITSELFEGPTRATGLTISTSVSCFTSFFLTKYFTLCAQTIGHAFSFWLLTFCNIVTCLFVVFFIPETKGKTFLQIQNDLNKKHCRSSSLSCGVKV